jgi:hypothetical protein
MLASTLDFMQSISYSYSLHSSYRLSNKGSTINLEKKINFFIYIIFKKYFTFEFCSEFNVSWKVLKESFCILNILAYQLLNVIFIKNYLLITFAYVTRLFYFINSST